MHGHDDERTGPPPSLDELYAGRTPPPALEQRAVADFRSSGLIRSRREEVSVSGPGWGRGWLRAAAALVIFASGWWVGSVAEDRRTGVAPVTSDVASGRQFMLILWEGQGFSAPADPETTAAEYAAWGVSVARSGIAISGDELGSDRVVVGDASAVRSADGARVGGYFIVGVEHIEEARALLVGHPHLVNGGSIEVAPIITR